MQIETVEAYGVNGDGTQVPLGQIPIPPQMKFKEILASYFGHGFEADEDSPGSYAMYAFDEFLTWQKGQQEAIEAAKGENKK